MMKVDKRYKVVCSVVCSWEKAKRLVDRLEEAAKRLGLQVEMKGHNEGEIIVDLVARSGRWRRVLVQAEREEGRRGLLIVEVEADTCGEADDLWNRLAEMVGERCFYNL